MNSSKSTQLNAKYNDLRNEGYPTHHFASIIKSLSSKLMALKYADTSIPVSDFSSPSATMRFLIDMSLNAATTTINGRAFTIIRGEQLTLIDNKGYVITTAAAYKLNSHYTPAKGCAITHSVDAKGNRGVIDENKWKTIVDIAALTTQPPGFNAMIDIGAVVDSNGMKCRFFLNWNGQLVYAAPADATNRGDNQSTAIGVWIPKFVKNKHAANGVPVNHKIW
jgi:hypothetical protein